MSIRLHTAVVLFVWTIMPAALPSAAQTPARTIDDKLSMLKGGGPTDPVLAPEFEADYDLLVLGSVAGVPPLYGGVFILPSQPNTLYIGGDANDVPGALYAIGLVRDGLARITGFSGTAVRVADAPYNDGGITPDPGGLISYAQWPVNRYGQIDLATGALVTDIDLTPLGVASASATVAFIPPGYPGAGGMRLASWEGGQFYVIDYTVGAGGLIAINSATQVPGSTLPGGPEGWAYVPLDSPQFPQPSMIVSEYSAGTVAVFEMDAAGNPVVASRRLFISDLEGAEGAAIDPLSGAFIFSTFGGGDRVVVVNGFGVPPQGTLTPANFDFGVLAIGTTSAVQAFMLTNTGDVDLPVASLAVAGDYYEITVSDCPQGGVLAANTTCAIQVICTPTAVGAQAGTLTATTGAGNLVSNLQCVGAPVQGTLTPSSFDFGTLPVGSASPAQPFTLTNTGDVPLPVASVAIADGFYAITANDCPQGGSLAVDASCTVQIACTPTASGAQAGSLSATTDAGVLVSNLQCAGAPPPPQATLTPVSFDFGMHPVGATSPAQSFTLANTGEVPLAVTGIVVGGSYYADTGNDCPQGGTLAAGASCTVQITCTPTAPGAQTGTLTAGTDAGTLTSALQCAGAVVGPAPPPEPVPANGRWALLALLLGVLAMAGYARRRVAHR